MILAEVIAAALMVVLPIVALLTEAFTTDVLLRVAWFIEAFVVLKFVVDRFTAFVFRRIFVVEVKLVDEMFTPPDLSPIVRTKDELMDETLIPL
jgi:uncharacterized membrane protein